MSKISKLWFDKARDYIKWSKDNLAVKNYPLVCYLSHQAVEVVLKGYLYYKNEIPPKTHQLLKLAQRCEDAGLKLSLYAKRISVLSVYYFETRYPDSYDEKLGNKKVAEKAHKDGTEIVEFVIKHFH